MKPYISMLQVRGFIIERCKLYGIKESEIRFVTMRAGQQLIDVDLRFVRGGPIGGCIYKESAISLKQNWENRLGKRLDCTLELMKKDGYI